MYCPHCGAENGKDDQYCSRCGQLLTIIVPQTGTTHQAAPRQVQHQQAFPHQMREPGRGGLIFALGLLSLLSLGPILGIPAWIMGKNDMWKIRSGRIPRSQETMTKTGMIIGIVGTFISPLVIVVIALIIAAGVNIAAQQQAQEADFMRQVITANIATFSKVAYQHYMIAEMNNGRGSYDGFTIPPQMKARGKYAFSCNAAGDRIEFIAVSKDDANDWARVTYGPDGKIVGEWQYSGKLAYRYVPIDITE